MLHNRAKREKRKFFITHFESLIRKLIVFSPRVDILRKISMCKRERELRRFSTTFFITTFKFQINFCLYTQIKIPLYLILGF